MSKNSKIILKERRCVYPTLANPKSFTDDESQAKYSIKVIIPKEDKEFVAKFKTWVKSQIDGTDWSATMKKQVLKTAFDSDNGYNDNCVLKDGDHINQRRVDEDKDPVEAYENHYIISANRKGSFGPPLVVGTSAKPLGMDMIESEIIGGYWVNVQVSGYCYSKPKAGVSIQLQAVQKVREDDPFGRDNPFEQVLLEISEESETVEGNPFG